MSPMTETREDDIATGDRTTSERIIVFTRWPEPGKAKTRLIPALGPEKAALLQGRMTAHVIAEARRLRQWAGVGLEVRYEGGSRRLMRRRFGYGAWYRRQPEGDLGQRMHRCFRRAFREGCDRVVLVGSDCPGVSASVLCDAVDALRCRDMVLGPAEDGGYYLIGLRRAVSELFDGPTWGSSEVLRATLGRAEECGLSHTTLEALQDVDRPEDLGAAAWLREESPAELISVVVPALNEAGRIKQCVQAAKRGTGTEIIVVDGGSDDGTPEEAAEPGVEVLRTRPGRAHQMNVGAEAASGDALLFLHADTLLPDGYGGCVRRLLADDSNVAGAFRFSIGSYSPTARFIERTVNMRARRLQLPYGDQALFLRRETFDNMGGFPDMPIMEDYEFVRRLRARGRIAVARPAVYTSPRRWQTHGELKTTFVNKCMVAGYHAGIPPSTLATLYRDGVDSSP